MYNDKNFKTSNPPTFLLSLVAGTGVILIILALAFGVIQADANSSVIGMAVAIGVTLTILISLPKLIMGMPMQRTRKPTTNRVTRLSSRMMRPRLHITARPNTN